MRESVPLATLLSHALVAFTIEFDNEAERRMPHRTTRHGVSRPNLPAPWLVSLAMWENCMRHLPEEGIPAVELERRARTTANLAGMERWRYVTIAPDPTDSRPKPPRSAWIVKPTRAGRIAQEIWRPLAAEIEGRWRARFGAEQVTGLREALAEIDSRLAPQLPDCMPILKYGLLCAPPKPTRARIPEAPLAGERPLYALLARPLLAFALEFEADSKLSLAICANLVRVLDDQFVRVRDLPVLSGVSKEGLSMAMGILRKARLAVVEKSTEGEPWLLAYLTPAGRKVKKMYLQRLEALEQTWRERFGEAQLSRLTEALQQLGAGTALPSSPLDSCLEATPENWRAALPRPSVLPDFPMVLHRGGYPDGS